jgi:hypothetical protein
MDTGKPSRGVQEEGVKQMRSSNQLAGYYGVLMKGQRPSQPDFPQFC